MDESRNNLYQELPPASERVDDPAIAYEEAIAINWMIEAGILTNEMASEMQAKDIDRFVGYYRSMFEKTEVIDKEIVLRERDGYPSDQCLVVVKNGQDVQAFQTRVIQYYSQEELTQKKLHSLGQVISGSNTNIGEERNGAIEYRQNEIPQFKTEIVPITSQDLGTQIDQCQTNGITFMQLEIDSQGGYVAALKTVNDAMEGYIKGMVRSLILLRQRAQYVKDVAVRVFQDNKGKTQEELAHAFQAAAVRGAMGNLLKEDSHYEPSAAALALNILLLLDKGDAAYFCRGKDVTEQAHMEFDALIKVFAPQDALRMLKMYDIFLESYTKSRNSLEEVKDVPRDIALQGCRIAEVGGSYSRKYQTYGADVTCPDRDFSISEFGGIKGNEAQITLSNYERHYHGQYDISFSRQVMDYGSGVEKGFSSAKSGSADLLAVFANITRPYGITIHQGGAVPSDGGLLNVIGLELLCTLGTIPDPTYVFLKLDDRKVAQQDIMAFM